MKSDNVRKVSGRMIRITDKHLEAREVDFLR